MTSSHANSTSHEPIPSFLLHESDDCWLEQVEDQLLRQPDYAAVGRHASQAVAAAQSWQDFEDCADADPGAGTPQPSRHAALDAGSEFQHIKLHTAPGYTEPAFSPPARPNLASPTTGVKGMTLLQQATAPRPKQLSPVQPKQTPALGRSTKKVHPLYGPASVSRQSSTQPRKAKQKQGTSFAIRQPATANPAAATGNNPSGAQPNALRQLLGATRSTSAAPESNTDLSPKTNALAPLHRAGSSSRPTGLAALLGVAHPTKHEDTEFVEREPQDESAAGGVPVDSSPRQPPARRQSLLDAMITGELAPDEPHIADGGAAMLNDNTPMPTAFRGTEQQQSTQAMHTPSMMLQRQFIAKMQDVPVAPSSQLARPAAPSASLSARLTSIVQHEKAQHASFEAVGSTGGETMTVTIVQQQLEGHVVKCRCYRGHDVSDKLFVMFNNKLSKDVSLHVGSSVTLHAPWTHLQLHGYSVPTVMCLHVSAC